MLIPPLTLIAVSVLCFVAACSHPSPLEPVSHRALGVVVHHVDAGKLAELHAMGVTSVRIPYYGDLPDILGQLAVLSGSGLQVVVIAMTGVTDTLVANIPAGVVVQVGNEPLDPVTYADTFAQTVATYGPRVTLWPAGLRNSTTPAQLRQALAHGLGAAGVICLHAYGDPLADAIVDRLAAFREATQGLGNPPQLVFSEVGTLDVRGGDLGPALGQIPASVPSFVYDLDGTDGFALTPAEQHTVAAFTGVQP